MSNNGISGFRQTLQSARIHDGVESGALTRREAHALRADQREISAAIKEAKSNGHFGIFERMKINQMQNEASADIFGQKHDSQRAGANTPRVDARQERQADRISAGLDQGELTSREAMRLLGRQSRIERAEDRAKADGTVTPEERARLDALQDAASRAIHRARHDGRTRG